MIEDLMLDLKKNGNDVDGTMARFMNRTAMYEKYLRKYLADPSFSNLTQALLDGDVEEAFKASHTLKGVASNLGLTVLCEADIPLVEKLRKQETDAIQECYDQVKKEHLKVVQMIQTHLEDC